MHLKYVFIILSIIVLSFIFYKQYDDVQKKRERMTGMTKVPEMASPDTETSEMQKIQGNIRPADINEPSDSKKCSESDFSNTKNLPLREYCVKSSFNSAYDGADVSVETLLKRIKEGYRFIDLNVFSASGDIYVGFSQDNAPKLISNKLLLSEALKQINETAFSNTTVFDSSLSRVSTSPLFVHIRVYRQPNSVVDVIAGVEKIVNGTEGSPPSYSNNYLRNSEGEPEQINGCTNMSVLSGKMIFSMDILNILEIYAPSNYQSASTLPPDTIMAIRKIVNILTGGSTFPAFYRYTEESIIYRTNKLAIYDSAMKGSFKTNVKDMFIAFPHPDDVKNGTGVIQPDVVKFILDRSIQFTPVRVYLADTNLDNYVQMFDTVGTPFAPMWYVYNNLQKPKSN
jgi:hypothetical protein